MNQEVTVLKVSQRVKNLIMLRMQMYSFHMQQGLHTAATFLPFLSDVCYHFPYGLFLPYCY